MTIYSQTFHPLVQLLLCQLSQQSRFQILISGQEIADITQANQQYFFLSIYYHVWEEEILNGINYIPYLPSSKDSSKK